MTIRVSLLLFALLVTSGLPAVAEDLPDDIVQLSPDTYMITRISRAGIFASPAKLKAGVIRDANEFAASRGKIAVPLAATEKPVGGPGQWPSFEYQFRVVDASDPEAKRTSLTPRADVVIESNHNISGDMRTKDETHQQRDIYAELIKLDDLRKKGIITDAEFEAQKQRVLSGQ